MVVYLQTCTFWRPVDFRNMFWFHFILRSRVSADALRLVRRYFASLCISLPCQKCRCVFACVATKCGCHMCYGMWCGELPELCVVRLFCDIILGQYCTCLLFSMYYIIWVFALFGYLGIWAWVHYSVLAIIRVGRNHFQCTRIPCIDPPSVPWYPLPPGFSRVLPRSLYLGI